MNLQAQIKNFYDKFVPLLITELKAAPEFRLNQYCCPQLPYVGDWYESAKPRLMIVGKAPNGWDYRDLDPEYSTLDDVCHMEKPPNLLEWSRKFIVDDDQLPYFSGGKTRYPKTSDVITSFWRAIYKLVPGILDGTGNVCRERNSNDADKCFRSIVWTNVFKIGMHGKGNPDSRMEKFLSRGRIGGLLADEITLLKPDLVLFFTGPNYDPVLEQMLPGVEIKNQGRIAKIDWPKVKFNGFRTDHPGYWTRSKPRFNPQQFVNQILESLS
jgi:hypothetical protein